MQACNSVDFELSAGPLRKKRQAAMAELAQLEMENEQLVAQLEGVQLDGAEVRV